MVAKQVDSIPCNEGEFQWRVCTKYMDAVGGGKEAVEVRPAVLNEHPTHIMIVLPGGILAQLALRYHGEQANGASWEWCGNREAPTLTPSINAQRPVGGWHGWLTGGELRQC